MASGLPKPLRRGFPAGSERHKKFGTAIILFPDGLKVDVATARLEIYDSPAALPTVERGRSRWTFIGETLP